MFPVSFLLTLLKIDKGVYFVKAFGHYLLVSLIALLTLTAFATPMIFQGKIHPSFFVILPLIGGFTLYMSLGNNSYEARKQALMQSDYESLKMLQYDVFFIIGALLLYVAILFVPLIAINPLTRWLLSVMEWIYNLPVIGWLLVVGGVIFLITTVWHGILFSAILFGSIVEKIQKRPRRI